MEYLVSQKADVNKQNDGWEAPHGALMSRGGGVTPLGVAIKNEQLGDP